MYYEWIANRGKRRRHYGGLWTRLYFRLLTKPEFLVAKDEILAALATVPVAISSGLTLYLTTFHGWPVAQGVGEMFRHHVRSCEIGRTYSKFGRPRSDDRLLLFPALDDVEQKKNIPMFSFKSLERYYNEKDSRMASTHTKNPQISYLYKYRTSLLGRHFKSQLVTRSLSARFIHAESSGSDCEGR